MPAAQAHITPKLTFDTGASFGRVSGDGAGQAGGPRHFASWTVGLGVKASLDDLPLSVGAALETYTLPFPGLGEGRKMAVKLRFGVRILHGLLPADFLSDLGFDVGTLFSAGTMDGIVAAHLTAGYQLGHGLAVLVRGQYDVAQVSFQGLCGSDPTLSVARCASDYNLNAARAIVGFEYAF